MVTIDCADPQRLAAFWSAALGVPVQAGYADFVLLERPAGGGPVLGLQRVPEARSGKNRVRPDPRSLLRARAGRPGSAGTRPSEGHLGPLSRRP